MIKKYQIGGNEMKRILKRTISLLCVLAMMASLTACGGSLNKDANEAVEIEEVVFPLKEEVTFTFMLESSESTEFAEQIANNSLWKKLKDETNVNIEFQFLNGEGSEKLALLISSGKYGDVLWGGPILSSALASKYITAGNFVDITSYVTNEELMPNLNAHFAENEKYINMITATDGRIYTVPKITALDGNYVESPIWINKAWLDKLGLSVPTTVDEFVSVLEAFRDKDPNGNGAPDEIPYIASTSQEGGYAHTEALLGLFGVATKGGVNDSFVMVEDGKANFAPALEGYKAGMKFLNQLYKNKLLWSECFTSSATDFSAKMTAKTCVVGCFTGKEPEATAYSDEYICIAPPKAEGYEPSFYLNPYYNGAKNLFYVTNKCKNINVLMAWVDKLFELENAIAYDYGTVEEGRVACEGDTYTILDMDYTELAKINEEHPTLDILLGSGVRGLSKANYENNIILGKSEQTMQNNYEIYKDYLHTEIWPRPYFLAEDAYDADVYCTDLLYQVESYRGKWITGALEVDKTWDEYINALNKSGLKEYEEILQRAYDAYLKME